MNRFEFLNLFKLGIQYNRIVYFKYPGPDYCSGQLGRGFGHTADGRPQNEENDLEKKFLKMQF